MPFKNYYYFFKSCKSQISGNTNFSLESKFLYGEIYATSVGFSLSSFSFYFIKKKKKKEKTQFLVLKKMVCFWYLNAGVPWENYTKN